jgi:PKD repeat protein
LCVSLLPVAAYSQAPLFTFAQISDSQPASADDQKRYEAVLDKIVASGQPGALIPRRVSFVLFVGDLVNIASSQNEWTTWLNTINTRLTASGIPYRAVPGNHDRSNSVNFTNYQTYIGSTAVWESGSDIVTGYNGLTVTTGWRGLDFIGLNNSNGGYNVVSATDVALVDQLASQAALRNENIFLVAHHPHIYNLSIPLAQTLNNPAVVGYMHGHSGSPRAKSGLSGIQNPNVWELNSQSIQENGAILYYEVYPSRIVVYPIQLTLNSTSLPAPQTITLVRPMVLAGSSAVPTASFTASPLSGTAPLTVAFTDQSAGQPTAWAWDFGDGSGSTLPNPTHLYTMEGLKTVTLVATNSLGSDQFSRFNYIDVTVPAAGSTFLPVADAKVNFSSAGKNYGTEGNLRVRGGATPWNSYLKFDVVGLGGSSVQSATLRLYVNDASKDGGTLFRVPDTSWSELGITFANAPPFGGSLGNAGATSTGQWIAFDVTSVVAGEGQVSFGLTSSSTDSGYVDSREGAFPPELIVVKGDSAPDITVNPLSYNYGSVAVGQSASQTINIKNDGLANLSVTGLSLAGSNLAEFGLVGPSSFVLTPGASQNVQANFIPGSVGAKSASLSIASDDPDETSVHVSLEGAGALLLPDISVTPTSHNFGSVAVTQSGSQSFVIKNDGTSALNVTSTNLSGLNAQDFGISNGGAFNLAPGASRNVQVSFNPSTEGAKNAVLELVSDDPDESFVVMNLTGTGISVSTANISLQEVKTGGSTGTASVATATALAAANGHVYLASISSKSFQSVSAVNGLGLVWTRLSGQCSGRKQTGVSIWTATGTPSVYSGVVTATFSGLPSNAVIAVARYSGVGSLGGLTSANTNGAGGACSGGLDSSSYGVNLTTTGANSVVYEAVAMRNTRHTAGGGFLEQVLVYQGTSNSSAASVAGLDQAFGAAGVVGVAGSFSGVVDWAVAAVELRP